MTMLTLDNSNINISQWDAMGARVLDGMENDPSLITEYKRIIDSIWTVLIGFYDNNIDRFPARVLEIGVEMYDSGLGKKPNVTCAINIVQLLDGILADDCKLPELAALQDKLRILAALDLFNRWENK